MTWPDDKPWPDEEHGLILSVGRLEKYKGHHRVIAAMPIVLEQKPSARLAIVGAGPFEAELRQFAHDIGVESRVEIFSIPPSERERMAALIARASLVTLLSDYESQGLAAFEAIALKRRLLVADTSALSELARKGLAESIPIESTAEFTGRAILSLLDGPARVSVELPTWDDCASSLAEVYVRILEH
jgi:glycosyltransferase involved in cell wall biosynthesis